MEAMREGEEWTPDDALRLQSFIFAVFRALDKASPVGPSFPSARARQRTRHQDHM